MSPKNPRPAATKGFTLVRKTDGCGKLFITVTVSQENTPIEVFVRFGKAGGCGSAMADGIAKLVSYGLRSGMEPTDAVKALAGIQCHQGPRTCLHVISEAIGLVLKHLDTGKDINDIIEDHDGGAEK